MHDQMDRNMDNNPEFLDGEAISTHHSEDGPQEQMHRSPGMEHSMHSMNMQAHMDRAMDNNTGFLDDEAMPTHHPKDGPQQQMHQWFTNGVQPWVILPPEAVASSVPVTLMPSYITNAPNPEAFNTYRSQGVPSDCGTIPHDSGYGSCHGVTASVGGTSVCGEEQQYPLPNNVEGTLQSFHFPEPPHTVSPRRLAVPSNSGNSSRNGTGSGGLFCEPCRETVKTRSELK